MRPGRVSSSRLGAPIGWSASSTSCLASLRCPAMSPGRRTANNLIEAAVATHGRVDVLVNNAGIGSPEPAETETVERFEEVLEVNVTALFAMSQLAGRVMLEQRNGSIINLASILGLVASAPIKQASYTASKGAVVNLTRELAVQWARKGVRVNAIAPGWFPSEMTTDMFTDPSAQAFLERNAPMARWRSAGGARRRVAVPRQQREQLRHGPRPDCRRWLDGAVVPDRHRATVVASRHRRRPPFSPSWCWRLPVRTIPSTTGESRNLRLRS